MDPDKSHKCRVTKMNPYLSYPWVTECTNYECDMRKGYCYSVTWEEAILEALYHKMRNE
jgi:hypothetical protein